VIIVLKAIEELDAEFSHLLGTQILLLFQFCDWSMHACRSESPDTTGFEPFFTPTDSFQFSYPMGCVWAADDDSGLRNSQHKGNLHTSPIVFPDTVRTYAPETKT